MRVGVKDLDLKDNALNSELKDATRADCEGLNPEDNALNTELKNN